MKLFQNLMLLGLVIMVAAPLSAADDAKKKGKDTKKMRSSGVFSMVNKLDLTKEQQEKVNELKKEHGPKLVELVKKLGLDKETRAARAAAMKEANEKGLKGKDRKEFLEAKFPLSDEQVETQKSIRELNAKIKENLASILTEEQQAKLKIGNKAAEKNRLLKRKRKKQTSHFSISFE